VQAGPVLRAAQPTRVCEPRRLDPLLCVHNHKCVQNDPAPLHFTEYIPRVAIAGFSALAGNHGDFAPRSFAVRKLRDVSMMRSYRRPSP
jgi:hypothetical protein